MSRMLAIGKEAKILNRIIQFISINMMNVFILVKKAAKEFFHYETMLWNVTRFPFRVADAKNHSIPVFIKFLSALPMWVRFSSRTSAWIAVNSSLSSFPSWNWIFLIPRNSSFSGAFSRRRTHFISKIAAFAGAEFSEPRNRLKTGLAFHFPEHII